jgi:hypothetical protein
MGELNLENFYLSIWLEQFKDKNSMLEMLQKFSGALNIPIEEVAGYIDNIAGYPEPTYELLQKLSELYDPTAHIPEESISSVKKQLKYCKNPMKRKQLEQKLNQMYKDKKGW